MKANFRFLKLGTNLLVACLTTLLMLGALELFTRAFVSVRNVGAIWTVYDPVYGKRLKANLHAVRTTPEFRFEINTNSLGMRDPEPTKPVTQGIVFIGDSFTMGYGVEDNETFPALIRAALESRGVAMPVVNAGIGDTGDGRWVKFFDHDAAKFRPRIVVFQVMAHDSDDKNLLEHLFELDANGALRQLPVGPPSVGRKIQTLIDRVPGLSNSYLLGLSMMAVETVQAMSPFTPTVETRGEHLASDELKFALIRTVLDKALASRADVVCLLVRFQGHRRAEMIKKIFEERGISCLDGPNKDDAPDMFFKVDGHWNVAGQHRAAELLLPEILRLIDQPQNVPEQFPPRHVSGHQARGQL